MVNNVPHNKLDQIKIARDKYFATVSGSDDIIDTFLLQNLPAAFLDQLDLSTKDIVPSQHLQSRPGMNTLLSIKRKNGQTIYLYLTNEVRCTQPKELFLRVHRDVIAIMNEKRSQNSATKFPFIYPIVLHSGEKPLVGTHDSFDIFTEQTSALGREYGMEPLKVVNLIERRIDPSQLEQAFKKAWRENDSEKMQQIFLDTIRMADKERLWNAILFLLASLYRHSEIKDNPVYNELFESVFPGQEKDNVVQEIYDYLHQENEDVQILGQFLDMPKEKILKCINLN